MKLIYALLILLVVSVGCSKNSDGGKSGTKDIFIQALESEPSDLHPIRASEVVSTQVRLQSIHYASSIIETLLITDLDTYESKPHLAERFEVSKDQKTFTFYLRKDVKFHDGTMMTSEDVDFSFKALFDDLYESYPLRSFYTNFVKSEIVDKYTIKFTAKDTYFLNLEVIGGLRVFPKAFYSKQTKENRLGKTVMGSGPYKFDKWNKGKSITLVENTDWWGRANEATKDMYRFKRIIFKFIKEANLRRAMLERGKLDYEGRVRPEDFVKKMNKKPWGDTVLKVKATNKLPKNMSFIGLNNNNKILKNRLVRKALAHLVNREFINEKFYYGMNEPATGPFRIASDYSNPKTKAIPFDPQKAKAILTKAGWTDTDKDGLLDKVIDGVKTPLVFSLLNSNKDTEKVITVIKEDMKKAGVKMVIETIDWNAFTKALDERKFDAVIMSWGGGGVNPDPTQIWHSKSANGTGSNFVSYKNLKVDALIESAINVVDKKKRLAEFHKIHDMIAEDAPYIFFFEPKYSLYAVSSRVVRPKDTYNYSVGPRMWSLPE
ncbi:MAG: ABC transporter substrate-binding protein [Bdellovibrionales bacterium]